MVITNFITNLLTGKVGQFRKSYFCIEFYLILFFNSYNEKTRYLGDRKAAVLYRNEVPFMVHPYFNNLHYTRHGFYVPALPYDGSGG